LTPKFSLLNEHSQGFGPLTAPRSYTSHRSLTTKHAVSPTAATLTRPLEHKSLPCHSYEYMGGRGSEIPYLVDIADSALGGVGGVSTKSSHFIQSSSLSFFAPSTLEHFNPSAIQPKRPNSRHAFTYNIPFPQVLTRHHIRFSPQPKPLCAFTCENRGGTGVGDSVVFGIRDSAPRRSQTPALRRVRDHVIPFSIFENRSPLLPLPNSTHAPHAARLSEPRTW
jgi:hypothetical protein